MTTGNEDLVRVFLREQGCGPHTIESGLPGLIENWEAVVRSVRAGYSTGLDDYLNDLDLRQLIEGALAAMPDGPSPELAARLLRADETMQSLVEPLAQCLWGEAVAEEEGWTASDNWWYYAEPRETASELRAEIAAALALEEEA
jgi:hypothetical protein